MPGTRLTAGMRERIIRAYANGVRQKTLAQEMKLSQPTVSRVVRRGIADGSLKLQRTVKPAMQRRSAARPGASDADQAATEHDLVARLQALAGREGNRRALAVVEIQLGEIQDRATRIERLAQLAAPALAKLLRGPRVLGVARGVTLGRVVAALETLVAVNRSSIRNAGPLCSVVPVWGESLGKSAPTSLSSSSLAERVSALLNGHRKRVPPVPSLGLVPALIPQGKGFERTDIESVWKLLGHCEGYLRVFGTPRHAPGAQRVREPFVDRLDTVLTAVSDTGQLFGYDRNDLLMDRELAEHLAEYFLGDVAGVPLVGRGMSSTVRPDLEALDLRWTGLRLEHLAGCAERASGPDKQRGPGVIVFAIGAEKAACVVRAVELGLVNYLFVDERCRVAIEQVVRRQDAAAS